MRIADFYRVGISPRGWFAALVCGLWLSLGGCSTTPPGNTAAAQDVQVTHAADDELTTGWPVAVDSPSGEIQIYQPQPESLDGNQLKARAAVSLNPSSGGPDFGVAWFTARVNTDRDTRTATLDDFHVSLVRLLGVSAAEQQQFANAVAAEMQQLSVSYSLDQLMTSLDTAQRKQATRGELKNDPPRIVFSDKPAVLISVDGPPQLRAMAETPGVSRVVNTPFILLQDVATHRFYLKEGTAWASAAELNGPWAPAAAVPGPIEQAGKLLTAPPATQPAESDSASGPPAAAQAPASQPADLSSAAAGKQVIVSTVPAELIVTRGDPQFTAIPGGQLLYATNTDQNLFLDASTHQYYVLLAGRWYTAGALTGPWTYVPADKLPGAFADIPDNSPKASVLTFVAGTVQARDALLDAAVPQTAAIRRDAGSSLNVSYDGSPQFKPVQGCAGLMYAANTPDAVLQYQGVYYCCHQAVWYQATTPTGPWTVSTHVPDIIYSIPPSNPLYNVTFVHIYDYYPQYVYEGYTPGYTGTYEEGPTVVYGTGYDYPAWDGSAYFPEPLTWGFDPEYDPYTGYWGFDDGLYPDDLGWFAYPVFTGWWHDHPHQHFGYHRWWGEGGFLHRRDIGNRIREAGGFDHQPWDHRLDLQPHVPGRAFHGPGWHNLYARSGNAYRNMDLSHINHFREPTIVRGAPDDVFAGEHGEVFRRTDAGWMNRGGIEPGHPQDWSVYGHIPQAQPHFEHAFGGYAHAGFHGYGHPEAGLERDFGARMHGFGRASAFHHFGGGFHGGFHGGGFHGGGFHGGGGHR